MRGATLTVEAPAGWEIWEFQSTRPVRGATGMVQVGSKYIFCISIHAPREGRDISCYLLKCQISISIHAPREGRDTRILKQPDHFTAISIHAPREGRDPMCS